MHYHISVKLYTLPGVEIFSTGFHRGRWWTRDDLRQIHANFKALSEGPDPYHRVPAVIGHEEDQEILKRSDLPAAAVLTNLRYAESGNRDAKLVVDYRDVPETIADWVRNKLYRATSAEVYPNYIDHDGVAHGLTLRRVAMLGGEPPQQKNLAELPMPVIQHGDRQETIVVTFNFGETVNRDQMLALISSSGAPLSQEFLDSQSDEQLALLIACLNGQATPSGSTPAADGSPPPAPSAGATPAPTVGQMSDGGVTTIHEPSHPAMPKSNPSQVTFKYFEGQLGLLRNKISAADQLANRRLVEEKARTVQVFCDRMVTEGILLPAQIDRSIDEKTKQPKNPANVFDRLMRADNLNKVYRFGENGGLASEFELQMAEIERGPKIIKFGEQMPDAIHGGPSAGRGQPDMTPERRQELLAGSGLGKSIMKKRKAA